MTSRLVLILRSASLLTLLASSALGQSPPQPAAAPEDAPAVAQPEEVLPPLAVEDQSDVPAPPPRKRAYSAMVWLQPVGLVFGLTRANEPGTRGRPMLYLPIGADASVNRQLDLVAEFTLNIGHDSCDLGNCRTYQGWWVTFGANWRPFDGQWVKGFFVQPKLIFSQFDEQTFKMSPSLPPVDFGGTSRQLHLGADVGYQLVLGRLYFALLVGVSGGYCANCAENRLAPMWGYATSRSNRFTVGYNLNLLRMGWVFY